MVTTNSPSSFADLGLRPELVESLTALGFAQPTDVQASAIPLVLNGRDLMVQSRTGSGKTLAFALPTLHYLSPDARGVKVLVVAPTRELANQVAAVYAKLGRSQGLKVVTLTGGMPYGDQLRGLRQGVQVVVGTPGRLLDHMDRGSLDLSGVETFVLDEADEILDMGFQEDLEKLMKALPSDRQTVMFSATLSEEIERIARAALRNPERLKLSKGMEASTTLTHAFYEVHKDSKYEAMVNLLHTERPPLAMVFCHTKADTEDLWRKLSDEGFKVGYLNGNLPQATRSATLESFRRHQITLLVATDVAARGIDVRGITHVFNYDIPRGVETYIHRSGRTGRAGHEGLVLNLVTPADRPKVRGLMRDAKLTADFRPIPQAEEVKKRLRQVFFEDMVYRIDAAEFGDLGEFARELLENLDPTAVVTALLQDVEGSTGRLAGGYEIAVPRAMSMEAPERPVREKPARGVGRERTPKSQETGMCRLRFSVGKADRMVPGYLVRMICDRAKIKGDAIGSITLQPRYSLVDVRSDVADHVMKQLNGAVDDRGRKWFVTQADAQ